jgi:hypothetical protein
MGRTTKYEFTEHKDSKVRLHIAIELIKFLLRPNSHVLAEHRQEFLRIALWKITEAESTNKHRTRLCSRAVFASPNCECRHDHVFQRAVMVQDLLSGGPADVERILEKAVACTITKALLGRRFVFGQDASQIQRQQLLKLSHNQDFAFGVCFPIECHHASDYLER